MSLDEDVVDDTRLEQITPTEKLAQKEWDRENLDRFFEEVENNVNSIESFLQQLNSNIDRYPSEEELDSQWSGWFDEKGIDPENKSRGDEVPAEYYLAARDKIGEFQAMVQWYAELYEQLWFALDLFESKYMSLLEEYRTSKHYGSIKDVIRDEAVTESEFSDKMREIEMYVNEMEKMVQSYREERKADRKINKELAEAANGVDEEAIAEIVEKQVEKGVDRFVDGNEVVQLNREQREESLKRSDRDEAADSAASKEAEGLKDEDGDDGIFKVRLKDKDGIEERAEALAELAEEVKPQANGLSQDDVAEHTDMTRQAIYSTNGVLEKCHENDLFPGIDV